MKQTFHRTKILCTVGPAIASLEKLEQIIRAGANAFRLNMSHGAHDTHLASIQMIREVEQKLGKPITIVADVQGPKIRVGDLAEPVTLANGKNAFFADEAVWKKHPESEKIIPVRYTSIARDVVKGDILMFDDGLLKVEVVETDGFVVKTKVINGGLLKSRKGMNMPTVRVSMPSITPKDKKDIAFAVENGCDYIAISFVRKASDMISARAFVKQCGGSTMLIAKIEKPEALQNLEAIIDESDAVMVARGDLGVEIPASQVPIMQKRIIRLCNENAKPVITATQMLESMIQNPRPTRAEASDVANAVLDGTDAVMLSAETSVGAYPVEAVAYMRQICEDAERQLLSDKSRIVTAFSKNKIAGLNDGVARAVGLIANEMKIDGIGVLTYTGKTLRYISNERPAQPIIGVTLEDAVSRKINLFWGVTPMKIFHAESTDAALEDMKYELVRRKIFPAKSTICFTIGRPLINRSHTNMLCIETLEPVSSYLSTEKE